jgi:hypothetical protein
MSLPINIQKVVEQLVQVAESPHFLVHYELRNPLAGKGMGPHGVRDPSVIETYLSALESLYEAMTAAPWCRDSPLVGADGKTHVYVFNSGFPLTTFDSHRIPYIILTSRNNEPTTEAELNRAASEAVHEATHLFNFSRRPLYDTINSKRWDWFDEGLAVLMEMIVVQNSPDHFRFLMDWVDSPEMSLDHPAATYQAGMFLHYVAKRLGPEFVNSVWLHSHDDEEPLQALERLMPDDQKFFCADSGIRDVFASGYCIDPYCLWEHASEVFIRFGERAVTESLSLPDDNDRVIKGSLDHLSCRYYRFYLQPNISIVEITLSLDGHSQSTPLKAEVAVVTTDRRRIMLQPLCARPGEPNKLSCCLDALESSEIEHVVLVVSNCGTNISLNGDLGDHDGRRFSIEARGH